MKKEQLKNAYLGIASTTPVDNTPAEQKTTALPHSSAPLSAETIEGDLKLNAELHEALHTLRTRNIGRPAKGTQGRSKDDNRATFIVSKEIVRKLKFIALQETRLYKDIVAEALEQYIEQYQAAHGTIPVKEE